MKDKSFLDTNIWIYAATGKYSEPRKYAIARNLVATETFAVSGQIIGEFFVNVRHKKMKSPLSQDELSKWLETFEEFLFVDIDANIVKSAIIGATQYNLHYWDSSLLAQAERFGATTFFTEDLNHGQLYGTVRACNPFLHT
jgi:predicted nucleic acid-binding protein